MLVVPSRSVHLRRHFPSLLSYPPFLYHVLLFPPLFTLCSLISSLFTLCSPISSFFYIMFSGLRSRWTMWRSCRYSTWRELNYLESYRQNMKLPLGRSDGRRGHSATQWDQNPHQRPFQRVLLRRGIPLQGSPSTLRSTITFGWFSISTEPQLSTEIKTEIDSLMNKMCN